MRDNVMYIEKNSETSNGAAFLAEFFWTAALVSNATLVGDFNDSKWMSTLSVAFTVSAGAFAFGDVSGAVFNPAVGFGLNVAYAMVKNGNHMGSVWIYIIAPSLGAVLATFIQWIFKDEITNNRKGEEKKDIFLTS